MLSGNAMVACLEDVVLLTDNFELPLKMSVKFFLLCQGMEKSMKKTIRAVLVVFIPKIERT
jgi:hypothetical protein